MIDGTALPALFYRYNEHLITLVAARLKLNATAPASADLSVGGFAVVHWSSGTFYWAVSDTERHVLDDLARRFRETTAKE